MANHWFNQFNWTLEKEAVTLYANVGFGNISTVTTVADVAHSLAGKFFRVNGFVTGRTYMFWFKVSGVGTSPATTSDTAIEVDIATGASANSVATAVKTDADVTAGFRSDFTLTRVNNILTFTALAAGCLNARDGLSMYATGFAFSNAVTAPFLDASKSKGIKTFTKTSTGLYTVTFGTGSPTSVTDLYPRLLYVRNMFVSASSPAARYLNVVSQAVSSAGTVDLKLEAADGTTLADPACGETLLLEFTLKNTTAQ